MKRLSCENMKYRLFSLQSYTHKSITSISVFIVIYVFVCVCVCICDMYIDMYITTQQNCRVDILLKSWFIWVTKHILKHSFIFAISKTWPPVEWSLILRNHVSLTNNLICSKFLRPIISISKITCCLSPFMLL